MTLLTCTPYMINSHRLLVTGERTKLLADAKQELAALKKKQKRLLYLVIAAGMLVLLGILAIFWRRIRKRIITHHSYTISIPNAENDIYNLFYKKSNNLVCEGNTPIVLQLNSAKNLNRADIKGGKYVLKGKKQQYLLWIDKINQANFSYKINNKGD